MSLVSQATALPIVHHPAYDAPLPEEHRFPMGKFKALAQILVAEGLAPEGFHEPTLASREALIRAHDAAYVDAVMSQTVSPMITRRIGLPITEAVALRARAATGGTLLTAELALRHGLACNTAGGSHHAARDGGAGFCVFNDVAVAALDVLERGGVSQILVVDLDVHQGDGTALIFADDPRVFTFSMHAEKNYPSRKPPSDLDIGLESGLEDAAYLARLSEALVALLERVRPELVFYVAGVDPHRDDQLGLLALSDAGLAARERFVISACRRAGVAVACVLGGGYGRDVGVIAGRHAHLYRAASEAWASMRP